MSEEAKKTAAYILAGLAMMLNIRLSYSSAPYALIRFRLHENLFSVFVRRMSSALELWCLPSLVIANVMEQLYKRANLGVDKKDILTIPSIVCMWLNFITFVILLFVYRAGGDQGYLTTYYWTIAISGFVFGINMPLVYAQEGKYITWYMIGENSFPAVTSFIHYITTLIFGNRRKWNSDFLIVTIDIWVAIIISLVAAAVWTGAYYRYTESSPSADSHDGKCGFQKSAGYWLHFISPILMVLVGMGLVYMIYPGIAPGMIVPFYLIDKIEMILLIATAVPPVIVATLKHNEFGPFVLKGSWGVGYHEYAGSGGTCTMFGGTTPNWNWQPAKSGMPAWHLCDVFVIIMITLAYIFIYSLHYKDSKISRAIINQPKMSTILSILFYMSHEISLAVGFPGLASDDDVILPVQLIGAFLMVLLAPYSEGYIIEYKSHDPQHWPTEGMTRSNAFCYLYYLLIICFIDWFSPHGIFCDKV